LRRAGRHVGRQTGTGHQRGNDVAVLLVDVIGVVAADGELGGLVAALDHQPRIVFSADLDAVPDHDAFEQGLLLLVVAGADGDRRTRLESRNC